MEFTHLGKRLKTAREHKGYSTAELARKAGVKRTTLERWEDETVVPRVNKLQIVAGILNVPLIWLFAGGENVPDETAGRSDAVLLDQKVAQAEQSLAELANLLEEVKLLSQSLKQQEQAQLAES